MEEKAALRRAIKERLQTLSENERRVESNVIVRMLRTKIEADTRIVAVYSPYIDEPNIVPLITELLELKFVVCMPAVDGRNMKMFRIQSLESIRRNPITNIPEPLEKSPLEEKAIDIVLVPGRAFSDDCRRLGRGNGGYDTWIHEQRMRNPKTLFIGLCFDCQIVDKIPMENHDEKVDMVLTASKIFVRKNNTKAPL